MCFRLCGRLVSACCEWLRPSYKRPQKFFQGAGKVDISLILFQVANDTMQLDLHKTHYLFYTTKKIPHESRCSGCIFLKSYSGGVVFEFAKRLYFCRPLQLLLNWGIVQYHYYCEVQTTESELVLNYQQLRLRRSP